MIANPIVVPMYATPEMWILAVVAMLVEVQTVAWLLRRTGRKVDRITDPLALMNLVTWFPFLVALDRAPQDTALQFAASVTVLEIAVIVVETFLIRELCAGRLFVRDPRCGTVTLRQAAGLSIAGNLASIATSVGTTLVLALLLRHR